MWHVWGRGEVHIGLWWGDLMEGDNLEDLSIEGRIILKYFFKKWRDVDLLVWRRIVRGGRLL